MDRRVLDKYVARYALPASVAVADAATGTFDRAVVVPACGETDEFLGPLAAAAERAGGRTLLVLVVNARDDAGDDVHAANAALLAAARGRDEPALSILAIDRASVGQRLGPREGVGTARRLGLDTAATLAARGRLGSPWLYNTDGDARVPPAYFDAVAGADPGVSAVVLPFVHARCGDDDVDRAHRLYEMSLRYYCLGLNEAGSPYAHHSMGSAMVFHVAAYAAARGMPQRQAAEDFYMLDKLAKLGEVSQPRCPAVELAARRSSRVPFGTGRAVARLVDGFEMGRDLELYDPACFAVLARVLAAIEDGSPEAVAALADDPEAAPTLEAVGALTALVAAAKRGHSDAARRRRLREWFDGFRTMRFIHELRDRRFPLRPWRDALEAAPFLDVGPGVSLSAASEVLCRLEWERLRSGPRATPQ